MDPSLTVSVVMPAYNEVDGIVGFLAEIVSAFSAWDLHIEVVDDCSTDGTADAVEAWAAQEQAPVTVTRSAHNRGHGPTTLTALRRGLERAPHVVVAVDGDGQVHAEDLARLAGLALAPGVAVVEGVRAHRDDPFFRHATSLATRLLVGVRARSLPKDANTPVRAYRLAALTTLLAEVPDAAMTPNLYIATLARRRRLVIVQAEVPWFDRRGRTKAGTSWGQKRTHVPSKRFVRFCIDATKQWLAWSPR
ncbi:MAG: glycosyltransferase family 2 protein [Propionibacteriaceae bacterium]|nr:glycosyltransferase family 2 protein [Propionibacteriaceae bacterium]